MLPVLSPALEFAGRFGVSALKGKSYGDPLAVQARENSLNLSLCHQCLVLHIFTVKCSTDRTPL